MTDQNAFIEVQGTAEGEPFHESELNALLGLAKEGISRIHEMQLEVLVA